MRKRRIVKGKIKFISLVPKGANRMPVILKDDGAVSFDVLTKLVGDELLGIVYAPEMRDSQGDIASAAVIKQMAHDFLADGGQIDFRHDEKPLAKTQASVAESFIIQKGDPRFEGFLTTAGDPVNTQGAWGVVLKVPDPEIRGKFESGEFAGLSMGGHAQVVETEKEDEDVGVTIEDLTKANAPIIAALVGIAASLSKQAETPPADEPKGEEAPVFKGSHSDAAALKAHAFEVRAFELRKTTDWTKADSVSAYAAEIEKLQNDAKLTESPDERIDRLEKENRDLRINGRRPSNQGAGSPPTGTDLQKGTFKAPTEAAMIAVGKEMALMVGSGKSGDKAASLGGCVIKAGGLGW